MTFRRVLLLFAAVAAAIATAHAMRRWLDGRQRQIAAPASAAPAEPRQAVLVARDAIPAGSFLTPASLAWQEWPDVPLPASYVLRGEATPEDFAGAVARRDLATGEPITTEVLVRPGERGFLAAVLEPGMRAISVAIDEATGNAGLVFPGDRVDVVLIQRLDRGGERVAASEVVVRDVRVLAVGQRLSPAAAGDRAEEASRVRTATLEVTPEDAKRIALAQQLGVLVLSLRSLARPQAAEMAHASEGPDAPLWDHDLSRAVGSRRGVRVIRGSEAGTVTTATGSGEAER
ncbi:hypothetical protein HRbin40_02651 [bacterium HR40]|nr:hypothetical protein HRbin40_02651 [bacterium HR40]